MLSLSVLLGCCLQEKIAFDEIEQVHDGPGILATLVGADQESIAANDGLGPCVCKFVIHETPKPLDFVHDEAGRDLAVVDGNDSRCAPQCRTSAAEEQLQVDQVNVMIDEFRKNIHKELDEQELPEDTAATAEQP